MKLLKVWMSVAVIVGFGTAWQTPAQNLPADKTPPAAPNAKAVKPKKVWTNEDIERLRGKGGVSVVGDEVNAEPVAADAPGTSPAYVKEKDPAWYRGQLAPLREQIIEIDLQIQDLSRYRSAADYAVNGTLLVPQLAGLPLNAPDQIKNLKLQRAAISRKIDGLEDQARHNEILPGDLR